MTTSRELTLGEGENSLEAAVVANTSLISNLGLRDEPPQNQLAACLNKMRNMVTQRHKLLVLDNADDHLARHYDELPKSRGGTSLSRPGIGYRGGFP